MIDLRAKWGELQLAQALLTRLPTGRLPDPIPTTGDAAWAFPFVGLMVGLLTGIVFVVASAILPASAAALLAIGTGVFLTGALHEDGLADTADGFGGGQTTEKKLDIMRDSRIGSYGVVALILTFGLIATAMTNAPPNARTLALFAAIGATSRTAMLIPMTFLTPARPDGLGHGATLQPSTTFWIALGIAAIAAVLTRPLLILTTVITAIAISALARKQIGGQTGDVLGATQKITECACWLTAAAYINAS